MALTAVETLTSVNAATETNIHTCVTASGEQLLVKIINESGSAGVINGLSKSTTSQTQNAAGNELPAGETIADKQTITLLVVMTTDFEFLVLNSSVAVTTNVAGWGDA
jgi:hypothetical protein